jgi:outer membrane protein assembly factor BamB
MRKFCHSILVFILLSSYHALADGLPELPNLWSLRAGSGTHSSPALSPEGILYFGSFDHNLYAVSTNRFIKWTFKTGLDIKSSPAVAADGTIYVGSRDRKFYAVTPAGELKWSFPTEGWVDSSPAIAPDGTVYFGSWDKKFYALTPNGSQKWTFSTGAEILSSPAIATDGTIYFGSNDKKLYALRPDGTKKWEFATGGPITSSPAIDFSGKIYFASVDGKFYALNPDGTVHWSTRTGGTTESSPVLNNDGSVYLCINDYRASITADGKLRPGNYDPGVFLDSTPALGANDCVCYATLDGVVSTISMKQPGIITQAAVLRVGMDSSPVIAPDGIAYEPTWMGMLYALDVGTTPMKSPWPMFRANPRHTGVVNEPGE